MRKEQFLNRATVHSFIDWISLRLDGNKCFNHIYILKRPRGVVWECDSIYSAYENYKWAFTCKSPLSSDSLTGETFEECKFLLTNLSNGLRESIAQNDTILCQKYCIAILDWGGVLNGNKNKVFELGDNITTYFSDCKERLNANVFNLNGNYRDIIMTAGFTKIYSLLIDDFIIYDGRVGAALGLLVRKYCEEKALRAIPPELLFAYGNSKGDNYGIQNRRNPSQGIFKFPLLIANKRHTENNIRANWMLKEILSKSFSKFNTIEPQTRLRAFESALFMIGYDVLQTLNQKI